MTSRTVKRIADAAKPEDLFQSQWQGRPSVLDEFKPYLDDRWNQGCTNARRAWEEIVPLGYTGSNQRVRAYFRTKRLSTDPVTAPPPSPRTVSGWILSHPRDRDAVIAGLTLALELWRGRRTRQPHQDAQTTDIRPGGLRPATERVLLA
ncbi:hypothetical protein [Streptomyces rhizosphaericus]|uniref:hypothetical protein n=1 Tax=Streptomyces rhizosphaericus TaxID=114699 RepID=UPI001BE49EF2|nr:hypothetical protein [Streptomyces rhizosphaericus]